MRAGAPKRGRLFDRHTTKRSATVVAMAAAAALLVAVAAGCGEREEPEPTTIPVLERPEQVPKLPGGWKVVMVPEQGLELGLPPGWRKGRKCLAKKAPPGTATVLCSPDKLLTLSITADRTDEALELPPEDFALRVMAGLNENYQRPLKPGKPKPFKAHYDGAKVRASGKVAKGVRQDVSVIVLRRDDIANITAVIAKHAARATSQHTKFAERTLRTLRSQPPS
jgi:hypothetical protein